jgi:hypothetical protein
VGQLLEQFRDDGLMAIVLEQRIGNGSDDERRIDVAHTLCNVVVDEAPDVFIVDCGKQAREEVERPLGDLPAAFGGGQPMRELSREVDSFELAGDELGGEEIRFDEGGEIFADAVFVASNDRRVRQRQAQRMPE